MQLSDLILGKVSNFYVVKYNLLTDGCLENMVMIKPFKALPLKNILAQEADALKARVSWKPSSTDMTRGRQVLLKEFSRAQNLPLAEFAKLAHKSRQQIYKDIAARRLLALNVGVRGQRLPDWQLDPVKMKLTQEVLAKADDVDAWTLFHKLSEPIEGLQGQSPLRAVRRGNIDGVVRAVLNALGIHGRSTVVEHT